MDDITAIIKGLLQHKTAPSLYQYITAYPKVLSERVDAYLVNLLDNLQEEYMNLAPFLASHIRTLRLCRLIGVDQVFKQDIAEKLVLIGYFLDLKTWEESQEFLESHPELVQEQVELLLDYLAQVQLDQKNSAIVQEHRELLKRCREIGIDEAFQEKIKALDSEYIGALYPVKLVPEVKVDIETECQRQNYIEWLEKIYTQIINTNKNVSIPEKYIIFFIQGLRVSWNNQGQMQVIYKFLEKNLDNLNDTLEQFLYSFNKDFLGELEAENLAKFAVTVLDLFGLIEKYPHGNEEINIEIAIAGYEIVVNPIIREAALEEWVRAQVYLATAYRDRIRGDKFENREKTILACRNGLEACKEGVFPKRKIKLEHELKQALSQRNAGKEQSSEKLIAAYALIWYAYSNREKYPNLLDEIIEEIPLFSVIQISKFDFLVGALLELSSAYSSRVLGNRSENLEMSISCCKDILNLVNCKTNPIYWAQAQNTLGFAYTDRIQGKHAQNVEKAIRCHLAALDKCTREVSAKEWARGQSDLGIAYKERILGESAENLEAAIQCYSSALEVYSRELYPFEWARTQYNLGVAYINRVRGNKAENLAAAIQCFSSSLEVYTIEDYPQKWATTLQALGSSYVILSHVLGNAEIIGIAIQCYSSALKVYSREFSPYEWARTIFNLGNAYMTLSMQKDKAENLETAIQLISLSLEVRIRKTDLNRWAMTQSKLGLLYRMRVNGERAKNIEISIQFISRALEVYSYEVYPLKYAQNQYFLGETYQEANQIEKAYTAFKNAINSIESIREEIVFGTGIELDKQKLAEEWNKLYQRAVEVCLELDYCDQAIEYIERSKTRNLVELILTRDRHTIFPHEVVTQLDQLRDEIASGQYELQNSTAENPTALAQHLQQLRQQRNELQDRYLPIGSGFQFEPFRATLSDRTAIVEFYITSDKLLVFIVTKQTQQPIVLSPDLIDLKKLANWANNYLNAYSNKKSHWQHRLTTRLNLLAKILHIDEIIQQIPTECNQLILIPHRYLHLMPLHALSLAGNSSLFDRFPGGVSYAPSCQLLQLSQTRQRHDFTHLFAVQNPTGDLTYTDIEVETIQSYFSTSNLLKQKIATREAIDDTSLTAVHCAHFSCHGYFNATQPRKSALILANAQLNSAPTQPDTENYLSLENGGILNLNKCLTLDSIFTLNLEQCRLVTLSACETGLIDFRNTSDEYIGLPSGFLYAGASSVVSSLWTVNDLSTAFLMIRFYQNLQKGLAVALALNQAQLWLKNLNKGDLETWIEENQLPLKPAVRMNLRRRLYQLEEDAKPFQSPFYWAAFCAIGQ